jgi:hypothetical protein
MTARPDDQFQLGFGLSFAEGPDLVAEAEDLADEAEEQADAERAAEKLLAKLLSLGLAHVRRVVLTRNRSILVSVKGFDLRVHEGFVDAPTEMHVQIVRFVMARRKWERQAARDAIIGYPLPRHTKPARAPEKTHPDDEPLAERLAEWHTRLNGERFGAQLKTVPIRVSRRMLRRLGHYAPGVEGGGPEMRSARATATATGSPARSRRCCTRWCISGSTRTRCRSIMGRTSGGSAARWGRCRARSARSADTSRA